MTAVDSSFSVQNAVSWFDHYLAALDCYIWTFGESLLNPDDIFLGTYLWTIYSGTNFDAIIIFKKFSLEILI